MKIVLLVLLFLFGGAHAAGSPKCVLASNCSSAVAIGVVSGPIAQEENHSREAAVAPAKQKSENAMVKEIAGVLAFAAAKMAVVKEKIGDTRMKDIPYFSIFWLILIAKIFSKIKADLARVCKCFLVGTAFGIAGLTGMATLAANGAIAIAAVIAYYLRGPFVTK